MEAEILRSLVFEHLKATPKTSLGRIYKSVPEIAYDKGLLNSRTLDEQDNDTVREIVWALLFEGVLVPGIDSSNPHLDWVKVTVYGQGCLASGEYTPHDPDGYVRKLSSQVPDFDDVAGQYLDEALQTFRRGNYFAATVMVGVASERIIDLLIEATAKALDSTGKKKEEFEKNLAGRMIHRRFEALWKRLEPLVPKLSEELGQKLRLDLNGIFDFIRRHRNDAGHPTARKFEREEVNGLLLLFPSYCKTAYVLMEWLDKNPI